MNIDLRRDLLDATPSGSATLADATRDVAADDASLLLGRFGEALGDIASAVDRLQVGLGPAIAAASAHDPALVVEAQALDLVSQSLRGLMDVLAAVGERRIGQEPLHLDRLASSLKLRSLADRISGTTPAAADADLDLF